MHRREIVARALNDYRASASYAPFWTEASVANRAAAYDAADRLLADLDLAQARVVNEQTPARCSKLPDCATCGPLVRSQRELDTVD